MATETKEIKDIIVEALEVLINHLLYTRNIYPVQIFRKRQMYNAVVYTSIYKPLNVYIKGVLSAARELLATDDLKCLELEIYDKEKDTAYERYQLEIRNYENHQENDKYLLAFEEELRNCLYKSAERLNTLHTKLPTSARFRINLQTNESAFVRLNQNPKQQSFVWLKNPPKTTHEKYPEEVRESIALLPLASIKHLGLSVKVDIIQQE